LEPPEDFFAVVFFAAAFFVAIGSCCSFFSQFLEPQDTVLKFLLWARVNGAQHVVI
jgi:hypothetical protein